MPFKYERRQSYFTKQLSFKQAAPKHVAILVHETTSVGGTDDREATKYSVCEINFETEPYDCGIVPLPQSTIRLCDRMFVVVLRS